MWYYEWAPTSLTRSSSSILTTRSARVEVVVWMVSNQCCSSVAVLMWLCPEGQQAACSYANSLAMPTWMVILLPLFMGSSPSVKTAGA